MFGAHATPMGPDLGSHDGIPWGTPWDSLGYPPGIPQLGSKNNRGTLECAPKIPDIPSDVSFNPPYGHTRYNV